MAATQKEWLSMVYFVIFVNVRMSVRYMIRGTHMYQYIVNVLILDVDPQRDHDAPQMF